MFSAKLSSLFWFLIATFGISACHADMIMQFGQNGIIGQTNFSSSADTSILLDIYITQSGTTLGGVVGDYRLSGGSAGVLESAFPVSGRGLGSYLFRLSIGDAAQGTNQTSVLPSSPNTYMYASGFSNVSNENFYLDLNNNPVLGPTSRINLAGFAPSSSSTTVTPTFASQSFGGFTPNNGSVASNSILIGTLSIDIGAAASGAYSLELSNPGSIFRPTLGIDPLGGQVDINYATATLTITSVPEPASWLLALGIAAVGISRRLFQSSRVIATERVHPRRLLLPVAGRLVLFFQQLCCCQPERLKPRS